MNRIYRLVWNRNRHVWMAVAENSRGRSKSGLLRKLVAGVLALVSSVLLPPLAVAAPVGGQVSAGTGSIAQAGTSTTITQSSQNLAINWQGFGVAANEAVRFNQPNASAIALNRVLGQSPSEILGSISANGQVFVLNPNGVLFGATARVNVGGLVASTLSISDADFMAGKHSFGNGGAAGSVLNQGILTAASGGYIALLAPDVRNEGVVSATLGTALLAAGDKVTLTLNNGSLLAYRIDQGSLNALAENKQLIQADGGQVFMSAKAANAISTAMVNNTGIIEARTVQEVAGVIKLMGDMQAGTVNVGGMLDASAANGGDGGFIETSAAHVRIANNVRVTTAAPSGKTGIWLIDPVDITIAAIGGNVTGSTIATALQSTDVTLDTSGAGSCTGVACGALGGTNGDIFVNDNINTSAGLGATRTLTLKADRNIVFQAGKGIDASAGGNTQKLNVILNSDADANGAGNIQMKSGASIISNGGDITLGGGANPLTTAAVGSDTFFGNDRHGVYLQDVSLNAGAGNISIKGTGIAGTSVARGIVAEGVTGTMIQTTSGNISLNGTGGAGVEDNVGVYLSGAGTTVTSLSGDITGTGQGAGSAIRNYGIRLDGGAAITSTGTATITLDGTGGAGTKENYGVSLTGAGTRIGSANGAISITGHGAGTAESNYGILMESGAAVTSTGVSTLTMNGTGGVGTFANAGVFLSGATNLSSADGAISITGLGGGTAAGTGFNNYGILVGAGITATGTGTITLNGTGGVGTDNNHGIFISNTAITSTTGAIAITGQGTGTVAGSVGIQIGNGAAITSTDADTITLNGTGGPGTDNNYGVWLFGTNTKVASATSAISVTGASAGTGGLNHGVYMTGGAAVTATNANAVTLSGTGGTGTFANVGVFLADSGTKVESANGAISITGQGAGTGFRNYGILMNGGAAVSSTGAATIAMDGKGGAGTTNNYGVYLTSFFGTGPTVNSSSGAISITGHGAGTGVANYGIFMEQNVAVSSTGAANITLDGRGAGTAQGIYITNPANDSSIGGAASTGNITLIAHTATGVDSIFLAGLHISGSGNLLLQPLNAATSIGLAGGVGTFNLDASTELPTIQPGFASITVGRDNGTGLIAFGDGAGPKSGFTFNANTTLRNPGASSDGITIDDPLSVGVKNLTLNTTGTSTQTAAITAAGLELLGAGGTHTLTSTDSGSGPGNAIATLAGNTGEVNYQQTGSLAVGSVGATTGLTASNGVLVRTTGASADLTLINGVTANGAGDALVLAAGRNFLNNLGVGALNAPNGRWLVYSISPADSTENGLTALADSTSPRLYNRTFAIDAPATIVAGNHLVYSTQPTLTVTADDKTRTYGDANPTFTATTTGGFVSDDGVTDTLASAEVTGAADLSSLATATSPVSSSPFTISAAAGDLASSAGYGFGFVDGALTIIKAHLTVTADDKSRLYGQGNPVLTTTVSGFVNGETAGTAAGFTGAGSATTTASGNTNVGTAVITAGAGSLAATNYAFTNLVDGTLTITQVPGIIIPAAEIITLPVGGILPAVVAAINALPGGAGLLPAFSSTVTVAASLVDANAPPIALSNLQYVYLKASPGAISTTIVTAADAATAPTQAQSTQSVGFNERLVDSPIQFSGTVLVRNGGIALPRGVQESE